ncbi:MAG: outer membrane beta-barrel protein [Candidatus Krumholzibacteria bacterium]|nr:outer membrane beta-barrel protein [Candidatus Krumholzibacteria bacterium]
MKYVATVVAMVAFVFTPMVVENAHGQAEFTLGGGVNSPLGDYSDAAKTGWAFTTGIGYRLSRFLAVGAEFTFNRNQATDEVSQSLGVSYDVTTSIHQYAATAKVLLPAGRHNLYGKGVVGSYRGVAKVSGPLGEASAENTDPGFGIGGGFLISGESNSSLYIDVIYHQVKFDGSDVDTNFVTYSAGAVFSFNLFD